jgi:hypothetical protein
MKSTADCCESRENGETASNNKVDENAHEENAAAQVPVVKLSELTLTDLGKIPSGTALYDIFACASPSAAVDTTGQGFQRIGAYVHQCDKR